ncbi:MAG: hypothetical protein JWO86_8333 [Myxococcaceae bacterium]|nr:hypothetical protein [Myxococcaceae bacterium]
MRRVVFFGSAAALLTLGFVFACSGDDPAATQTGADSSTPGVDSSSMPGVDSSVPAEDAGGVDSSTAADADADAGPPPYTPAVLGARMVLWLEGDSFKEIDGGVMWPDKSATGNDAFQDASARMPFLIEAGAEGGINGHSVVRFAGHEYLRIGDSPTLQWAADDFALYVVMRHENGATALPAYGIVYAKWTDTGPQFPGLFMWAGYPGSTGYETRLDVTQAIGSDSGLNDGTMRLVGTRRSGMSYELRVGGNQVSLLTDAGIEDPAAFNAAGLPAFIGGREAQIQQLQGDIAEIVAVKGTLTDLEQTTLEGYLAKKFGL